MTESPFVSVVMPAYNEEGVVAKTIRGLLEVCAGSDQLRGRVELVVVSDGSEDGTFEEATEALADGIGGTVVELVRNVGSHTAIRCGLKYATGDIVVIMAADGQDPPDLILDLVASFRPGIDVVWGSRRGRSDPLATRGLARIYYWLFRRVTGLDYPPSGLDVVAIRHFVVEPVLAHRERNASVFLTIFNLGYGQASVAYDRLERSGGSSSWTVRKRFKLAFDMLTAFSATPIRLVSLVGVLVGISGIIFGGITVVRGLANQVPVPGWASLMVVTSLMGGLLLVAVGLLGEYVWRTLDEVRRRPIYIESRHASIGPGDDRGYG